MDLQNNLNNGSPTQSEHSEDTSNLPHARLSYKQRELNLSDSRQFFVLTSTLDQLRHWPWVNQIEDFCDAGLFVEQEPLFPMIPKTNGHTVMALDTTSGTLYARQLSSDDFVSSPATGLDM